MVDSLVHDRGGPPVSNAEGSSRLCYKCNRAKPCSEFNLAGGKTKGLRRICKSCESAHRRSRRLANPEKARADGRARYHKRKPAARAHAKEWYAKWRKEKPLRLAEKSREYRVRNPDKSRQRVENYRRTHPEIIRAIHARRRARARNAPGWKYTSAQHLIWRWAMWGNCCWICGNPANATDHVIALAAGGAHWPANLRPICSRCNSRKREFPYTKFLKST